MKPLIFAQSQWWWAPVIIGIFALVVLVVILLKKHTKIFRSDEKPKSDREIAKEELDRVLQPIEEDNTKEDDEPKA